MKALALLPLALAPTPVLADDAMDAAVMANAIAAFAVQQCTNIAPDIGQFSALLDRLGVNPNDLNTDARIRQGSRYMDQLASNSAYNCRRLREKYGPVGYGIPGLLRDK